MERLGFRPPHPHPEKRAVNAGLFFLSERTAPIRRQNSGKRENFALFRAKSKPKGEWNERIEQHQNYRR